MQSSYVAWKDLCCLHACEKGALHAGVSVSKVDVGISTGGSDFSFSYFDGESHESVFPGVSIERFVHYQDIIFSYEIINWY